MFTTALEAKKFYEGAQFIISKFTEELKEILHSPDIDKLERPVFEQLVISKAKAIRYWEVQIDDYMDEVLAAFMNIAGKVDSPLLDIEISQVVTKYGPEGITIPTPEVEPIEVVPPVRGVSSAVDVKEKEEPSNEDILEQLMAGES